MDVNVCTGEGMSDKFVPVYKRTDTAEGVSWYWQPYQFIGRTDLVRVQGNLTTVRSIDEILQPHLLPAINVNLEIFQLDNSRPHVACVTADFLVNNVNVLPWRRSLLV